MVRLCNDGFPRNDATAPCFPTRPATKRGDKGVVPRVYFRTLISADNTFISRKFSQRNLSFWNAPHLFPPGPHPPSSQTTHSSHLRHERAEHKALACPLTPIPRTPTTGPHRVRAPRPRAKPREPPIDRRGPCAAYFPGSKSYFRTRVGIFPRIFPESENEGDPLISLKLSGNSYMGQLAM